MKNALLIFSALLMFCSPKLSFAAEAAAPTSAAPATTAKNFPAGLYNVRGKNSLYGTYVGQGWVSQDQVQRLVTFDTLKYGNAKVQTVWSGFLADDKPKFLLALSTTLTSYESFHPSPEALNAPVKTIASVANNGTVNFEVAGEGTYSETWTRVGDAPTTPLWVNLRQQFDGVGESTPLVVQIAKVLGINQAIDWYRSQPEAQVYKDREEFKNKSQFFIEDHTDAEFYAKNPNILRIPNKTLNPLAYAEATMRKNAYGHTLAEKATMLRDETLTYNLNPVGFVEYAKMDSAGRKIGRVPDYDSGLWSAMLGWAEVLRYQTTKDAASLQNFKRVLNGVLMMVEITQDPKQFARVIAISEPGEVLGEGWIQGKGPYAAMKWRSGGNNDMFKGLLITLSLAHQTPLAQDPAIAARIAKVAQALPGLDVAKDGGSNQAMANGLAALWNHDAGSLARFKSGMTNLRSSLSTAFNIDAGFYYGGIADWSGIHLSMVTATSEIILTKELLRTFNDPSEAEALSSILQKSDEKLFSMQQTYRPARRDFLTIMTYAYSKTARASQDFGDRAVKALWTLKEVPAPRYVGSGTADLALLSNWSLSAWPRVPWKAVSGVRKLRTDLDFKLFASSAYSYPQFEMNAWGSVYLWKDTPFTVSYSSDGHQRNFSSDYLLFYWVARASGLVAADQ
jgi:hypothetical protein